MGISQRKVMSRPTEHFFGRIFKCGERLMCLLKKSKNTGGGAVNFFFDQVLISSLYLVQWFLGLMLTSM